MTERHSWKREIFRGNWAHWTVSADTCFTVQRVVQQGRTFLCCDDVLMPEGLALEMHIAIGINCLQWTMLKCHVLCAFIAIQWRSLVVHMFNCFNDLGIKIIACASNALVPSPFPPPRPLLLLPKHSCSGFKLVCRFYAVTKSRKAARPANQLHA